ncbi:MULTISPECIES: CRISPR-associated RAMP protein Csx7 [Sphaerospermopsis]|uniref:SSO1426 family CRISPR-associated RAMP protein n=1 Tax=Sphaerospermopsis reniformis TaxID=531300 RepID=A0A479ZYS8_9CYAN|nr:MULTISPECIES: CRISPR-associated RAMP protein Csx7 [Sphaerospermopsis]MBD2145367.1 CRISPR-associated RAMP protein [Sphaerospermopsis sp. FACHB-1194]GCL36746.1 SSO1426 family CRISPR-associated RAMP protein [Sphaerospermopsis reniformis]
MFDTFKNRLEITGKLTTITALRISAGRSTEPIGTDLPVIKDALGQPLIPGSSFKGALRSRLESFLRGIDPSLAEDPADFTTTTRNNEVKYLKDKYKDNDFQLTENLLEMTDLISRLFGSPWIASKFQIRDLNVVPNTWFGQYQERDGVAIDRDTETAADGKLYDFQVVPASTEFQFHAIVENAEPWELGLLMIGLHQFETEQIPLGGGRSRGLGVVKLNIEKMRWVDVEDDPKFMLQYLQKLVMGDETAYEDAADYRDEWVHQLIDHLNKQISQKDATQTTA